MRSHRRLFLFVPALVLYLGAAHYLAAQDFPPRPRPLPMLDEECVRFSSPELERVLKQLKSERDSLEADWRALAKRHTVPPPGPDQNELQQQLKRALARLKQERRKPTPEPITEPIPLPKKVDPPPVDPPKKDPTTEVKTENPAVDEATPPRIDTLHLGHALYRAERFEEALAAFQAVDLKGKKAEERAPVIFLTASCMIRLGKFEEASNLLGEAAKSRGDERVAGYAQWQLEMLLWQREVNDRLHAMRQRRIAAEKRQ